MTHFKGRHFSGRLFAGRLFRDIGVEPPGVRPDVIPYGNGPKIAPKKSIRRRDRDDDVLLFILR